MDKQALTILQQLAKKIENIEVQMVTKDDLKDFTTKEDLKAFAKKEDLKDFATKEDLTHLATKDDLKRVDSRIISIEDTMATKNELENIEKNMVTKTDLSNLKKELIEYTDSWCADLLNSVDRTKADASEMENIKTRVRNLERKVALD